MTHQRKQNRQIVKLKTRMMFSQPAKKSEYQFNFGGFIDARYSFGLADFSSAEFPKSSIEWVYKNRVLQFGIGYQF